MKPAPGWNVAIAATAIIAGLAVPTTADAQTLDLCAALGICKDSGETDDVPIDLDVDSDGNLEVDAGVDVDSDPAGGQPDRTPVGDVDLDAVLDTTIDAGADGVVLTTGATTVINANAGSDGWLAGATAAARICGVQVAIAASSTSAPCAEPATPAAGEGLTHVDVIGDVCGVNVAVLGSTTSDCDASPTIADGANGDGGLADVAGTLDLCGTEVVVLARSSTKCGRAPSGPADAATGSMLAATGLVDTCGLSVVALGSSGTSCAGAVPGAADPDPTDPSLPGSGDPGDLDDPTNPGTTPGAGAGPGTGESDGQGSQPSAAAGDVAGGDGGAASLGSLPLTGRSLFVILWSAVALVVAGAGLRVARRLRPHD